LLVMAEMLYLFEERLIKMYCRDGPGRAEQATADALMAELIAEEEEQQHKGSNGKKGRNKAPEAPGTLVLNKDNKKRGKNKKKGCRGGAGASNCHQEEPWEIQARNWSGDRRANKKQEDDGMGSKGKDVLKLLCQNLRRRMTAVLEGKKQGNGSEAQPGAFKPRIKGEAQGCHEEDPEAQAAADDFERMLQEMKVEDERLSKGASPAT